MTNLDRTIVDLELLNALCHGTVLDDAIELLKEQPQIIRCKDCKHGRQSDLSPKCIQESRHLIKCGLLEDDTDCDIVIYHKEDWFCADGVKKDA